MRHFKIKSVSFCLVILLCLGIDTSLSAEAAWVTVRETDDGIVVRTQEMPGTGVRAVSVSLQIAASPRAVIDAAADPSTFENKKNYVEEQRVYKTDRPEVWHVYYLINFPFITRRDYTLRYEKSVDVDKEHYQLSWNAAPKIGPAPSEDIVRVTLAEGWIKATPQKQGTGSSVQYYVLADPGGNIPSWAINLANKSTVPDILRQIRDAALRRKSSP